MSDVNHQQAVEKVVADLPLCDPLDRGTGRIEITVLLVDTSWIAASCAGAATYILCCHKLSQAVLLAQQKHSLRIGLAGDCRVSRNARLECHRQESDSSNCGAIRLHSLWRPSSFCRRSAILKLPL